MSQPRGVRYNPELQPLVSELEDGPHHTPLGRAERLCLTVAPNRCPKPLPQTVVAGTLLVSELDDAARSGAQSVPFLLTLQ